MPLITREDWHYILPRCLMAVCGALCIGYAERFTMVHTIPIRLAWNLTGHALLGFSLGPSLWVITQELWRAGKQRIFPRPPDG